MPSNGTEGFSGDGGPATAAQLNFPNGVTLDGAGNLYIADAVNNRIRKVGDSNVIQLTVTSTDPPNNGRIFSPSGVISVTFNKALEP